MDPAVLLLPFLKCHISIRCIVKSGRKKLIITYLNRAAPVHMNSKKRILLLSGNYFPEPTGIGKYNGEMMDWLSAQNYDCGVVTSYPYYPHWKIQPPYTGKSFWYKSEYKRFLKSPS